MVVPLFLLTLFELFFGGGGRFTSVGSISLRMLLFSICISVYILIFLVRPQRVRNGQLVAITFVLIYMAAHSCAAVVGALAGHEVSLIAKDIKPTVFWLVAPFFAMALQSKGAVENVEKLVRVSSVMLSVIYLATVASMWSTLIEANEIRRITADSGELFFRGETFFFYKAFLYLGVGSIFFAAFKGLKNFWFSMFLLATLVLTLTRGMFLSLSILLILMLAYQYRWRMVGAIFSLLVVTGTMMFVYLPGLDPVTSFQRLGEAGRDPSIVQRVADLKYFYENMSVITLALGEGFGAALNGRQNLENTYLWAVWKLGIPGLLFWLSPIVLSSIYYFSISRYHSSFTLATAYYFGSLFIYLQTATNPYLNNPIGLAFVIVSMFALRTLLVHSRGRAAMGRSLRIEQDEYESGKNN